MKPRLFRPLGKRMQRFGRVHINNYATRSNLASRAAMPPAWEEDAHEPLVWQEPPGAAPAPVPEIEPEPVAQAPAGQRTPPNLAMILERHEERRRQAGITEPPSPFRQSATPGVSSPPVALTPAANRPASPPVQRRATLPPATLPPGKRRGRVIEEITPAQPVDAETETGEPASAVDEPPAWETELDAPPPPDKPDLYEAMVDAGIVAPRPDPETIRRAPRYTPEPPGQPRDIPTPRTPRPPTPPGQPVQRAPQPTADTPDALIPAEGSTEADLLDILGLPPDTPVVGLNPAAAAPPAAPTPSGQRLSPPAQPPAAQSAPPASAQPTAVQRQAETSGEPEIAQPTAQQPGTPVAAPPDGPTAPPPVQRAATPPVSTTVPFNSPAETRDRAASVPAPSGQPTDAAPENLSATPAAVPSSSPPVEQPPTGERDMNAVPAQPTTSTAASAPPPAAPPPPAMMRPANVPDSESIEIPSVSGPAAVQRETSPPRQVARSSLTEITPPVEPDQPTPPRSTAPIPVQRSTSADLPAPQAAIPAAADDIDEMADTQPLEPVTGPPQNLNAAPPVGYRIDAPANRSISAPSGPGSQQVSRQKWEDDTQANQGKLTSTSHPGMPPATPGKLDSGATGGKLDGGGSGKLDGGATGGKLDGGDTFPGKTGDETVPPSDSQSPNQMSPETQQQLEDLGFDTNPFGIQSTATSPADPNATSSTATTGDATSTDEAAQTAEDRQAEDEDQAGGGVDVDQLARDVFNVLRDRLRIEKERRSRG